MKAALISVFFAATASASEFLEWPPEHTGKWKTTSVSNLPPSVRPQDPEDSERALTSVAVLHADVDGDGVSDLIVDTGRGGTGGSYVFIYRREGKRYREVLSEQGGISISKQRGKIECWSRIGGMQCRRTVYRFDGRRFVILFTDSLKGPLDNDRFEVVERRKPGISQ